MLKRRALTGVVVLVAVLGLALPGAAQDLSSARQRQKELHAKLQQATQRLAEVETEKYWAEVGRDGALAQQKAAHQRLEVANRALSDQAASVYRAGGVGMMSALLDNDAELAASRAEFVTVVLGRQTDTVEEARAAAIAYDKAVRQVAAARAKLAAVLQEHKKLVTQLRSNFDKARRTADHLAGFGPTELSPSGRTIGCPLSMPYTYTNTWGAPRSGGRTHKGTDIMAPMNAKVHAYVDGVISRQTYSSLGGKSLYLEGDDGNQYYYAHLASYFAPAGKRVKAGELIAYNGDTGNASSSAPHVHFEVRPGGSGSVNPYPYVARACKFRYS